MKKKEVGVAVIGDVLDINCWSNIPYYFYTTGARMGLFQNPFRLDFSTFSLSQKLWNIKRGLTGKGFGGYQYSTAFLDAAEAQIPTSYFKGQVISFNQVFPRAKTVVDAGGEMYYYIDSTLELLFKDTSYNLNLSQNTKEEALAQEKQNYSLATKVITMGTWVQKSLKSYYEIPDEKLGSILPGANLFLPDDYIGPVWREGAGKTRDFILGFVGKDWERKGLGLLKNIKDSLKSKGYRVRIKVIGNAPESIKNDIDIDFEGFINKQSQMSLFIDKIKECDIGCLFSQGEALGISTLEFIKVGVPVAGFYHQGLFDTLFPDISLRFDLNEDFDSIINRFEAYLNDERCQQKFFNQIPLFREKVSWEHCINEWKNKLY